MKKQEYDFWEILSLGLPLPVWQMLYVVDLAAADEISLSLSLCL